MPNPGRELSSLDLESMIGGPLVAVVNAQAQAAMRRRGTTAEGGGRVLDEIKRSDPGGDIQLWRVDPLPLAPARRELCHR